MLLWSIIFFLLSIIAALVGFGGMANDSAYIAKALALIGIVISVGLYFAHARSRRRDS